MFRDRPRKETVVAQADLMLETKCRSLQTDVFGGTCMELMDGYSTDRAPGEALVPA